MPPSDQEVFYTARDKRTGQFGATSIALSRPICISYGDDVAESEGGQILLLALANMVARAHRHVVFDGPNADRLANGLCKTGPATLHATIEADTRSANPYLDLAFTTRLQVPNQGLHLAVGERTSGANLVAGADGAHGVAGHFNAAVSACDANVLGAATSAAFAAAILFQAAHDLPLTNLQLNAWSLKADDFESGRVLPKLELGRVGLVGAGAVGTALAYWLGELGTACADWVVVDGDIIRVHNLNRNLLFTARQAGWPSGVQARKADVVASHIGARSFGGWYDAWVNATDLTGIDLVIPVANERGVRAAVAAAGFPITVHATTSRMWEAQLHVHQALVDDCIGCRFSHIVEGPTFECSQAPIRSTDNETSEDASLPFLSAAAGALLLGRLLRLSCGQVRDDQRNMHMLSFRGRRTLNAIAPGCLAGCPASSLTKSDISDLPYGAKWRRLLD